MCISFLVVTNYLKLNERQFQSRDSQSSAFHTTMVTMVKGILFVLFRSKREKWFTFEWNRLIDLYKFVPFIFSFLVWMNQRKMLFIDEEREKYKTWQVFFCKAYFAHSKGEIHVIDFCKSARLW
jgi:hypothetical protein